MSHNAIFQPYLTASEINQQATELAKYVAKRLDDDFTAQYGGDAGNLGPDDTVWVSTPLVVSIESQEDLEAALHTLPKIQQAYAAAIQAEGHEILDFKDSYGVYNDDPDAPFEKGFAAHVQVVHGSCAGHHFAGLAKHIWDNQKRVPEGGGDGLAGLQALFNA